MSKNFYTKEEILRNGGTILEPNINESNDVSNLPDVDKLTIEIMEIIEYINTKELIELNRIDSNEYENAVELKFPDFCERYYGIFKKIIHGEDLAMLWRMLKQINRIKNGNINFEDAEVELGEELATKYISNYDKLKKNIK